METASDGLLAPPHARRYDAIGCHLAAIVLERIQYWSPRARVRHGEKTWIAKSRAELAHETRLSDKQVHAALEKLKAADLIETSRHKFGGPTIMHVRFTARGRVMMAAHGLKIGEPEAEEVEPMAQEDQSAMAPEGQSAMALQGQSHIQGDTNKGIHTGLVTPLGVTIANGLDPEISGEDLNVKGPRKQGVKEAARKEPKTAAEIAAMFQTPKVSPVKEGKGPSLGVAWQDALAKAYPEDFHPPLTMKWPTFHFGSL